MCYLFFDLKNEAIAKVDNFWLRCFAYTLRIHGFILGLFGHFQLNKLPIFDFILLKV